MIRWTVDTDATCEMDYYEGFSLCRNFPIMFESIHVNGTDLRLSFTPLTFLAIL